jgi:hypothetical protein
LKVTGGAAIGKNTIDVTLADVVLTENGTFESVTDQNKLKAAGSSVNVIDHDWKVVAVTEDDNVDGDKDYVNGVGMLYVFTDQEGLVQYNDKTMYDITEMGYTYKDGSTPTVATGDEGEPYKHVYACLLSDKDTNGDYVSNLTLAANGTKATVIKGLTGDQTYDINGNGAVEVDDAVAVLSMMNGESRSQGDWKQLLIAQFFYADVNRDGYVNALDASLIKDKYTYNK